MDEIHIRPESLSSLALYRGDQILVRGLTSEDATEFCRLYSQISQANVVAELEKPKSASNLTSFSHPTRIVRKGGRRLVLQDYVETIRSMIEENPGTTKRDVEKRLRGSGAKFASTSAIMNVAKNFNIKLRA